MGSVILAPCFLAGFPEFGELHSHGLEKAVLDDHNLNLMSAG